MNDLLIPLFLLVEFMGINVVFLGYIFTNKEIRYYKIAQEILVRLGAVIMLLGVSYLLIETKLATLKSTTIVLGIIFLIMLKNVIFRKNKEKDNK